MTRAQIEAARERVENILWDEFTDAVRLMNTAQRSALSGRLVAAAIGHPDGRAPKAPAGAGRKARRFAR
jgi:hypothetical protein